jgi:hypothetical protein
MQNGLAFEAEFDNGHDYSAWKWPGGASVKRLPWRERDPG